ncbi:MAG: ABC transporter permease subunit [Gammaproteobacteria bacterium]|jgi:ABC-2 type transport system permease protein|nr:ABC transporter permease subunit [Gammaproteobacteria bacterium]
MTWLITHNEFKRVWYSSIAWVLFSIALFVLGLLLLVLLNNFYSDVQAKLVSLKHAPGLTDLVIAPYLFWVAVVGVFIVPLFAVRSCTEERLQGADLLLSSAPISNVQIVLGKFFALTLFAFIYTAVCSSLALALGYFTALDYGKIAAACLGVFLYISSFCAAAIFVAHLTRTPIIATAAILGLLLVLVMLYMSGSATSSSSELFLYLSNFPHLADMLTGSIDTTHIAYFLLFTLLFLCLSVRNLNRRYCF